MLVGGAGAAAVVATSGTGSSSEATSGTAASDAHARHSQVDAGSAEEDTASAAGEDSAGGAAIAGTATPDGEAAADGADGAGAAVDAASVDAAPSGPAAWGPDAEAKNPWVAVEGAPAGRRLGLREDEANDTPTSARTGFRPSANVMAPTKAYRLQAHEVSWGELALATTIPELATIERPKWLSKSARRAVLPATGVPWGLARAYCRALGGDLPSEAEW